MATVARDFSKTAFCLILAGLCLGFQQHVTADDASSFKVSGFLSIIGGSTISRNFDANYSGPSQIDGSNCPCYVADWGNAGVYQNSFSLKPESRIGVQVSYTVNHDLSLTGQIVSRGSDPTPNIPWAYASYKFADKWEVQLGRKRIPLYYYSDFQDIGISYPWVSPPPELYGWEATNYNGASVRYQTSIGSNNITSSLFAGSEKISDSLYQRLYYPGKTAVDWNDIIGSDLELSNGPVTARLIYMQANVRSRNPEQALDERAALRAYGIAINLDFDDWFVLSELTQLSRDFTQNAYKVTAPAYTIGAGVRIGKWTPFINFASYKERSTDVSQYVPQAFHRPSITLRYDLDSGSAIKAQIDKNTDVTNNFGGNTTLIRFSYDRVF